MNQSTAHVCMLFCKHLYVLIESGTMYLTQNPLCTRLHWGQVRLQLWKKLGGKRRALLLLEHRPEDLGSC